MMFFDGNIAAPPTITVFSPDISLFILSCALTGATRAEVRASAPRAAADNNAIRFDMDSSPDGWCDRRMTAGDEGATTTPSWLRIRLRRRWAELRGLCRPVSGNKFS